MATSKQPITVYVVDDSDMIRARVVSMLITMPGVSVVGEAASASDAIDGILAQCPNVVLLDLNLGESSGMDVLRAVRPMLPKTRVIVLTNHTEPQYERACRRAGASQFLDKSTQIDSVPALLALPVGRH